MSGEKWPKDADEYRVQGSWDVDGDGNPEIRFGPADTPGLATICMDRSNDRPTIEALAQLYASAPRLYAALEAARIGHRDCEDTWYACPMTGNCSDPAWDDREPQCDCGADEHNARIDAALAAARGEPTP